MKIDDTTKQAIAFHIVKNEKSEPADMHGQEAAKQQRQGGDKVDLSSGYLISESKNRQEFRADRVEDLKAQLATGRYQIPSSAVAEKMLAKFALG